MPIYEVRDRQLIAVAETSFGAEGIYERRNIQQLLRDDISSLDVDLKVIAEEFGDWVDSSRRIDLLCLDRDANLVVVELKRTEDGGHMELQALRYAAMVSTMKFDQLVETHARFLSQADPNTETAKAAILSFLGWDDVHEARFGLDTRIVLAAADFGKELTTTALWLIDRGVRIRCVRLKPYRLENGPVLLDIQQIIPLPETSDFQTKIGAKRQAQRTDRSERHDLRFKFWSGLLAYAQDKTLLHATRQPSSRPWLSESIGHKLSLTYVLYQDRSRVELWIPHNRLAFSALLDQKEPIEKDFGHTLEWEELTDRDAARISYWVDGGYRSPTELWPSIFAQLTEAMIRLDNALRDRIAALQA